MDDPRRLGGEALANALRDSRARTWQLVGDLTEAQWRMPRGPGVNPFAWELGHIAWFAEFWILRGPHEVGADGFVHATRPPLHCGPDEVFDSSRIAHDARWEVGLPTRAVLEERMQSQFEACLAAIPARSSDTALYFHRLALMHEDMHGEAFAWMRAALGHAAPPDTRMRRVEARPPIVIDAAEVVLGRPAGEGGFSFDNEMEGRRVGLGRYEIDATPITNAAFARFVEAGGYETASLWPGDAGRWLARSGQRHPARWRRAQDGAWEQRWFDRWLPLDPAEPVVHVNAHEAEAYCRWAGRRLPTAAEWQHAATRHHGDFDWGRSVWEWTADAFLPYPGFAPGPYKDYSQPWFGNHRELRGGAFATHARLRDPRYRNFFLPDRTDVFAGFRTASGGASD